MSNDPERTGFTDSELAAAARAAAEAGAPEDHPPVEELIAYHDRQLGEAPADAVRSHLAVCSECAQLVLDYAAFPQLEPPSGRQPLTSDEVAAARRRLPRHGASLPPPPRSRVGTYRLLALAAGIALVLALGWNLLQVQQVSDLRAELAQLQEGPVRPVGFATWEIGGRYRSAETMREVEVPQGGDAVLRLRLSEEDGIWSVVVRGADGEELGSAVRVRIDEEAIIVNLRSPEPGSYVLELRREAAAGTPEHSLPFRVLRPGRRAP